ncbi:helix-turn-helix domain-containing protein [Rhodovulum steppense]|uniref:Helix-turn-helix protein n=1 Tax=Rhodovulum steppense TaxID=540251 RepID=A0A4R1YUQ2_9RHOB|nr:helix-turn-helix transcriptional regulator [Rhodovulum steppense]TCM84818.1 helix-turn-helix protein [Rhodovulum steppense]
MSGVSSRAQAGADKSGLGQRIRAAADHIGGLNVLAERLSGVSRRTLSDWVSDKTEPRASSLVEICEVTGADLSWLVTGEPQPQPQAQTCRQAAPSSLPADTGVLATLASAGAGLGFGDVAGGVALAVLFTAGLWVAYGTGLAMCGGCW